MEKQPHEQCCDVWRTAHQSGTDNESYGALIYYIADTGPPIIGAAESLGPVKFCPWCGVPKS